MLPKFSASAVLWLPLTLGVYAAANELYHRVGKTPLLNPTLLTILFICVLLTVLEVPYPLYFESVNILHYLLGTAVVALAIPIHRNLRKFRGDLVSLMLAVFAGSVTSIACGLAVAGTLGASPSTLLSIAPKSATAAVSLEIARDIGGIPAMAACLTIFTGIIGAILGPYVLTWSGVTAPSARGVALGTVSHGIATARAFNECELTGCCASLAMGLNAILTALLVPIMVAAIQIVN